MFYTSSLACTFWLMAYSVKKKTRLVSPQVGWHAGGLCPPVLQHTLTYSNSGHSWSHLELVDAQAVFVPLLTCITHVWLSLPPLRRYFMLCRFQYLRYKTGMCFRMCACVCMCDSVSRFCNAISCSALSSNCDTRQACDLCFMMCACVCVCGACVCMCDSVSRLCDAISCSAVFSTCDTRQGCVLGCVHVCVYVWLSLPLLQRFFMLCVFQYLQYKTGMCIRKCACVCMCMYVCVMHLHSFLMLCICLYPQIKTSNQHRW
jgi:hypothetical protein